MDETKCAVCGGSFGPILNDDGTPFTSGYGVMPDGRRICYACCANVDREEMDKTGRAMLYLTASKPKNLPRGATYSSEQGWQVGNWPGSLVYPIIGFPRRGGHNIAGSRYDVWFHDHRGELWHGVQYGEETQICHCRRIKPQWWAPYHV